MPHVVSVKTAMLWGVEARLVRPWWAGPTLRWGRGARVCGAPFQPRVSGRFANLSL